jgi:methyltransferase (TIGR00027 family)
MKEGQFSLTALVVAYIRGYHSTHDSLKVFDDHLAYSLLTDEIREKIEQYFTTFPIEDIRSVDPVGAESCLNPESRHAWAMQGSGSTLSRARHTEDSLEKAMLQGMQQYVILGAGMDTFAFRRCDLVGKLQVFELDHPATQAWKRSRIDELGWAVPENLQFVPVDFTKENMATALKRSAYDPQSLSFFSWLGVTYYLSREEVFATLRSLVDVAPKGSTIIFDYMDTDALDPEKVWGRMRLAMDKARELGEPMITGFDPHTLPSDLASSGLRLLEDLSPADIRERYLRQCADRYSPNKHVHFARAVVA